MCIDFHDQILLRGLKREGCQLQLQMQLVLKGVKEAKISFSYDGNMLALFSKDTLGVQKVRIFRINDKQNIKDLFDLIENDDYACELADQDFSQINKFKFDYNNRFIVGYGSSKVMIYPLNDKKPPCLRAHNISQNQFGKILELSLGSSNSESFQCFVACNLDKLKKISIFDVSLESPNPINLFYQHEVTDQAMLNISRDFKSFVFTDVKEKYLVEIRDNYNCQISLNHL